MSQDELKIEKKVRYVVGDSTFKTEEEAAVHVQRARLFALLSQRWSNSNSYIPDQLRMMVGQVVEHWDAVRQAVDGESVFDDE